MSEHIENVRRTLERGIRMGVRDSNGSLVDTCQHALDELQRARVAELRRRRRDEERLDKLIDCINIQRGGS